VPLLVQAAREITLDPGDQPIVIADYGSSQGKNSLAPIRAAIGVLRTRLGPDRPIDVVHTDLPANDFSTLFELLDTDPDRYVLDQQNVFPYAIGRSFYRDLFPPDHVHLGWSSYAAVWLSRLPTTIPDHFFPSRSTSAARAKFDRQGAQDWEAFLSLRAVELRRGGRLVIVLPGLDDGGRSEVDSVLDHANLVLAEMVDEGAITADEYRHMMLASYLRRERDLLVPFQRDGNSRALSWSTAVCASSRTPLGSIISDAETRKFWRPRKRCFSARPSCPHWRPRSHPVAAPRNVGLSATGWRTGSSAVWQANRRRWINASKRSFLPSSCIQVRAELMCRLGF
jgi:hypothetical protein